MIIKDRWQLVIKIIIFLILCYFPIFLHLDSLSIRLWDESRLANNAIEMGINKNYIVTYFNGLPDMWNTKPPLMIWLQVFFGNLIGFNELAIRLPSAFAALFTVWLITLFCWKQYNFQLGCIAGLVLLTSYGYIELHVTRTGDYDALLILWMTLYTLAFYQYIYSEERETQNFWLGITGLGVTLAVLTKGVEGLMFLPGLFILSLYRKKIPSLLKNKIFYVDVFLFMLIIGGYYVWREHRNSGYIEAVFENEIKRFFVTLETHNHSKTYFLDNLRREKFSPWIFFIPFSILIVTVKKRRYSSLMYFCIFTAILFISFISFSQTKCHWYDAPIFPLASIVVGAGIYEIFELLRIEFKYNVYLKEIIPYLFLFTIFYSPYTTIIDKIFAPGDSPSEADVYKYSNYLKKKLKQSEGYRNLTFIYPGYNAQILFYSSALNNKGYNIKFGDIKTLQPQDTIVVFQNDLKDFIVQHYQNQKILIDVDTTKLNIVMYRIINKI